MALKKEQFLVGQPRNPKGKASKIKKVVGKVTPAGRANQGRFELAPAPKRGTKQPKTPLNRTYIAP